MTEYSDDGLGAAMYAATGLGNAAEREFERWATQRGWQVTKRGWPDFLCRRGNEFMCVEVKHTDSLSDRQREAAIDLAARGIPVFVWYVQTRELESVSEVQRLVAEEEVSVFAAADALSRTSEWVKDRNRRLERLAQTRKDQIAQGRAEIGRLQADIERLTDDIGYLLRHIQSCRGHYVSKRISNLMRRHRDALWHEPTHEQLGATVARVPSGLGWPE